MTSVFQPFPCLFPETHDLHEDQIHDPIHRKHCVPSLDEHEASLKGPDNLETGFQDFDKNGDGKLTREEFVGPTAK